MSTYNNLFGLQIPQNVPNRGPTRRALLKLRDCGCLQVWNEFMHLSRKSKTFELDYIRLKLCIREQCWAPGDVNNISLSEGDKCVPYPKSVHRALVNKLKNAKDIKKEAFDLAGEKRKMLEVKHRGCHP